MKNVFVVIPTIRKVAFLNNWKDQFHQVSIIICEDRPNKSIKIPKVGKKIYHYSWQEIEQDLKNKSWIIPRKVSAIRNYGFLKAYQLGAEVIITLDDDCYPVKNHHLVNQHLANLSLTISKRWINTNPDIRHLYTRGMPYLNRNQQPVMLSHGLWTGVLDHDGPTHLQHLNFRAKFAEHFLQIIPSGAYFPMCSMNLAFKREITPLMYQPLMGENSKGYRWQYDRFDDIWAGIFAKKIIDHLGYGVVNGAPFVKHRKASDPFDNLKKQAIGIEMNEKLWQIVDQVKLSKKSPKTCYLELAKKIKFPKEKYFEKLREAMIIWADLF